MNVLKRFLAIVMVGTMIFSMTACGSGTTSKAKIAGTWIQNENGHKFEVKKDGTYVFEYDNQKYVGEWEEQDGVLIFKDKSSGWSSTGNMKDGAIEIIDDPGAEGTIGRGIYEKSN